MGDGGARMERENEREDGRERRERNMGEKTEKQKERENNGSTEILVLYSED